MKAWLRLVCFRRKRGSMRGGPKTHDGQQWSLNPIPDWKLYENPFFTEGHYVPKFIPRHHNAHPRWSANSFSATEALCASKASKFSSPILAPDTCAKPPKACDAFLTHSFPPPFYLPLERDKFMSGSLVSASKLAASFQEHNIVQRLEMLDCGQQASHAQAEHPHSVHPSKRTLCPSSPSHCKIPSTLEETRNTTEGASESNMASSQTSVLASVLVRVRSVEESQVQNAAVLHKLKFDLEDVASHVRELEFSQKSSLKEVNGLLQKFGEQMAMARRKEQEKTRLAFLHLCQEMEEERNTCRLLKLQNKKLADDLSNANIAAADVCEELERERKARELLEEVCNELAREIGEDKAEVEQLKQEQKKSRERLEEELKMMRMVAVWQDQMVKEDVSETKARLLEGDGKRMPLNELRSKLEAFVQTVGVPTNEKAGSVAQLASGVACSSQENVSSVTGNMLNRDDVNQLHVETETLNKVELRGSASKVQRSHKLRRSWHTRGQQRHNVRIANKKDSDFWEKCRNSAWASSDDELDQRKLIACENHMSQVGHAVEKDVNTHANVNSEIIRTKNLLFGGRESELATSSEAVTPKESTGLEQSLGSIAMSKGSHKKNSVSTHFESGAQGELSSKLEADLASSLLYSFSKDDTTSCTQRVSELKKKQESVLRAQDRHAVVTGVRDEHYRVYHHNGNLDVHKSTMMGSAGSELDHIYFEPMKGALSVSAHSNQSHEVTGDQDAGVKTAGISRGISSCNDEACCEMMAKCSQGCNDFTMHENTESVPFASSQERSMINVEGTADSGDQESMKKMSPWRLASAKSLPLPRLWSPSPDAFALFGGAMKRGIKACSLSPPSVQDEQRYATSSGGLHSRSHTMDEAANQQPLACIKDNSLAAQLIKARELENETKASKSSFRFSPLRRAVSYG